MYYSDLNIIHVHSIDIFTYFKSHISHYLLSHKLIRRVQTGK